MREYAKTPRTLADIPLTELSADDRRMLLQHAVLLTFIDGEQAPREKKMLTSSATKLRIPAEEAAEPAGRRRRAREDDFSTCSEVNPRPATARPLPSRSL